MIARLLVIAAAVVASAATLTQSIQPQPQASFALDVAKTGLLAGKKHHFVFTRYLGSVTDNSENPKQSRVNFTVQTASITCQDTWVSDKDRIKILNYALGEKMLFAAHYPEIRFVSTSVEFMGRDQYALHGLLTIRDRTMPVRVLVNRVPDERKKSWWAGSAEIRLSDFGLKPPSAALGTIGTADVMHLTFHLQAE